MKKSHRLIISVDEATFNTLRVLAFERKQSIAKVIRGMIEGNEDFDNEHQATEDLPPAMIEAA